MLTNLLPGLRELCAPLAAGYVWILALWLGLHPILPLHGKATGPYRDILDVADWAGKPGTFAAITFAAYLAGVLSIAAHNVLNSFAGSILVRLNLWSRLAPASRRVSQVDDSLRTVIKEVLAKRLSEDDAFRSHAIDCLNALTDAREVVPLAASAGEMDRLVTTDSGARWSLLDEIVDFPLLIPDIRSDLHYLAQRLLGRDGDIYMPNMIG
jgi:hypothetical protein